MWYGLLRHVRCEMILLISLCGRAHPYLQAVNLVHATKQDPHLWTHDGDMSETFGLEPNFGCCTANFNQGIDVSDWWYARGNSIFG